ncbi:MAG: hypothetical protein ACKVIH_03960 [Burkholderiales bacterium]
MSALSACSRTVEWQEEVLLNTGEIIWVTRSVRYSIKGDAGNPADLAYRPDWVETISFSYRERDYSYTGTASVMVLAISPNKQPVLIAPASHKNWYYTHNFPCVIPYYVQVNPDKTGWWNWLPKLDAWAYNLPANLMVDRDELTKVKSSYSITDKSKQRYLIDPRSTYMQKIDPTYQSDNCKTRN